MARTTTLASTARAAPRIKPPIMTLSARARQSLGSLMLASCESAARIEVIDLDQADSRVPPPFPLTTAV